MGRSTDDSVDWAAYSSSSATRSATMASSYMSRAAKDDYLPKNIALRESRNSTANPASTPVVIALDCSGSMQDLALSAVKNIGTLMSEIYDRKPVTDPHIMAMFFDDVHFSGPGSLQVTQFESSMVIIDQLKDLYFVNNGGGNRSESNHLPLHFVNNKVEADAFADGRKGFFFEMGDELVPPPLTPEQLKIIYGPDFEASEPVSYETLLAQAEENWHVFHIVPTRGRRDYEAQITDWRRVLGQRVIVLDDIEKLAEVLVATMQVIAGADKAVVAASFTDPGTALVVAKAIKDLTPVGAAAGVVRL